MKDRLNMNLVCASAALILTLGIWSPVQLWAAEPAEGKMMTDGKMKGHHQAMMAERKAQDAELTALVTKMNSAPQDQKLDLLAQIVTRIVAQRTAMTAEMERMSGEMMEHMPMSEMKGMGEKPADAQKEQK